MVHQANVANQKTLPRYSDTAMATQRCERHDQRAGDHPCEPPIARLWPPAGHPGIRLQFGVKAASHTLHHPTRRLRGATNAFDLLFRWRFKGSKFLNRTADEHPQERFGTTNLVHIAVGVVALPKAQAHDRPAVGRQGNEAFGRSTVTGHIIGLW